MYLQPEDYERLKEHRESIAQVSRTGSTKRDVSPWYVMDEIKRKRTGVSSDGMCPACVIDLYREFNYMLNEYEQQRIKSETD
jgi:hypothetical protein